MLTATRNHVKANRQFSGTTYDLFQSRPYPGHLSLQPLKAEVVWHLLIFLAKLCGFLIFVFRSHAFIKGV